MYEDLIKRLREESLYKDKATLEIMDICMEAAEALENLDAQLDVLVKEDIEAQQELAGYRALGTLEHLQGIADALRAKINANYIISGTINQAIDNAPTIDAVPVVRCKNCKYYCEYDEFDRDRQEIFKACECMRFSNVFGPDDFCSCLLYTSPSPRDRG